MEGLNMTDLVKSRRAFLLGSLLAGVACLAGADEALAAVTHPRRHRRIRHKYWKAPVKTPRHHPHPHPHRAETSPGSTRSLTADPAAAPIDATLPHSGGGGSGGGGGGGGGGGWSDRRLKRAVRRLGASPSGLPLYSFQYAWGGPRYVGVMAQDMLRLRPDAVICDASGYMRVDYDRLDVKMSRLAA
jgi:hypothetical protein